MNYQDIQKLEKLNHAFDFICQYMDIEPDRLKERNRKLSVVFARQTFYYLMRKYHYDVPFELIGGFVNYSHATVMHGNSAILDRMKIEPRLRKYINDLETAYIPTIEKFKYIEPTHLKDTTIASLQGRIDRHLTDWKAMSKLVVSLSNQIEEINQLINSKL